jgi:hypothetical protein
MTSDPCAAPSCEHHWTSWHAPGHIPYWVRTCTLCKQPDWDDLDVEIIAAIAELNEAKHDRSA